MSAADIRPVLFFDTGAWVALNEARDSHHEVAVAFMEETVAGQRSYGRGHTSELVLQETYTFLAYNYGAPVAHRVLERVRGGEVTVHPFEETSFQAIVDRAAGSQERRPLSFVDWSIVVAVERLPLAHVFSFDKGFARHGLTVVP